jgi:hypothetical protein
MVPAKLLKKFPYVRNPKRDKKTLSWASTAGGAQRAKPQVRSSQVAGRVKSATRPLGLDLRDHRFGEPAIAIAIGVTTRIFSSIDRQLSTGSQTVASGGG